LQKKRCFDQLFGIFDPEEVWRWKPNAGVQSCDRQLRFLASGFPVDCLGYSRVRLATSGGNQLALLVCEGKDSWRICRHFYRSHPVRYNFNVARNAELSLVNLRYRRLGSDG
jgi:hypothetical protein